MVNAQGKIIVIEGVDGCGKDSQFRILCDWLKSKFSHITIIETYEPWDNKEDPDGTRIRRILRHEEAEIDPGDGSINAEKFQTLYVASRFIHWVKLILKAIKKGFLVVSNRERLSTYAYGSAFGIPLEKIHSWHALLPVPDLTIYLRVSAKTALTRLTNRPGSAEYFEKEESLKKIVNAYDLVVGEKIIPNIVTVDGEGKIEDISQEIQKQVLDNLQGWLKPGEVLK